MLVTILQPTFLIIFIVLGMKQNIVKGVTHCFLPNCKKIVWPFMNYCSRTHADEGKKQGLIRKSCDIKDTTWELTLELCLSSVTGYGTLIKSFLQFLLSLLQLLLRIPLSVNYQSAFGPSVLNQMAPYLISVDNRTQQKLRKKE